MTHMGTCGRASRIWPSRVGRRGLLAPKKCDWQPRAARRGGWCRIEEKERESEREERVVEKMVTG